MDNDDFVMPWSSQRAFGLLCTSLCMCICNIRFTRKRNSFLILKGLTDFGIHNLLEKERKK